MYYSFNRRLAGGVTYRRKTQMSSNQFCPSDVLLNTLAFRNMEFASITIEGWFKEWKTAVEAGNLIAIMSLLHWGLRLAQGLEKQEVVTNLFCHYLSVADGHNNPKNFAGSTYKQATIFGNMSKQEALRMLADKAWMELCKLPFGF